MNELPLMEAFYTIQGEGFHQGKAAYFIRLGGCNVGCSWCDVKESWDAEKHPLTAVQSIAKAAATYPARLAVVTGGEPVMYDLSALTDALRLEGFKTHIETSGAYELTGQWDWVCLSPKKFKAPTKSILPLADELKIIVFNKDDFKWAEHYAAEVRDDCKLFLQVEWSKSEQLMPLIVAYVKENPRWCVSTQMHKFINVP